MSIPIYIPSKNRPAQCHLLLESLEKNTAGFFDPTVVYTYTDERFEQGYDKLRTRFPKVNFLSELNSTEQFYSFLRSSEIVGLFADDCIFFSPSNVTEYEIRQYLTDEYVFSFSFRVGVNVSIKDYINKEANKLPQKYWYEKQKFLTWDFRKGFNNLWESSFAFALGFDGCFYRSEDLLFLANNEDFGGISNWEKFICHNGRLDMLKRHLMASPIQSTVFAQQINHTHDRSLTNKGYKRSLQSLNDMYLDDYIIDIDSMDFNNICSTHDEISFNMKKV